MWEHWRQFLHQIPAPFLAGMLSAEDTVRIFRWLLVVLALTALFWGGLAARESIRTLFLDSLAIQSGLRVEAADMQWHVLPLALSAPRVQLQHETLAVELRDARVSLGLAWPALPVISIQASLLGGQLDADILPSGWVRPQRVEMEARWKNLDAQAVQSTLGEKGGGHWVEVLRGRISGSLTVAGPVSDLLSGKGALNMDMEGLGGVLAVPLLTSETLEHMLGRFSLRWQEGDIRVEEARLTNPQLRLDCKGSLRMTRPLAASTLRLRIRVAVESGQIRLALLPPRSQAAFASGQPVDVLLSGPLSKPGFALATVPAAAASEVRP